MKKSFPVGTLTLFAVLIGMVIAVSVAIRQLAPRPPPELAGILLPAPRPLGPMAFKDHTGRLYTLAELEGKWTFLFFGYTYCPDICPTTLSMMASVASNLEKEVAGGVQILFVSIDPGRDSPEILGRYLAHFHEDFTGITADEPKTRRFADQFGAMFLRDREGSADNYLMAHASSIYLVDPRANFIAAFSPPHDPATITSQFRQIRRLKS